ncbi:MAG TPA: M28 family metallopeptidase [Acidimicrobiia bacterium]|nr:M28 family metallopeptidase [Acidimicrobiia bacterium]
MLRRMKRLTVLMVAMTLATVTGVAPVAQATGSRACDHRVHTVKKLLECVTVQGVREHQKALQRIADRNDGTRASGTSGYDASVDYVVKKMRAAGYLVTVDPFSFDFFEQLAPSEFEQTSPGTVQYVEGVDFFIMDYSGSADVTAAVTPVDVVVPIGDNPANTSTSGCEPEDFAGFTPGNIALMQRGTCPFAVKAANAETALASAAVIFNEGQEPDRSGLLFGTLGEIGVTIPVIGTSYQVGADLATAVDPQARVFTLTFSETRHTANVLAESRRGDPTNVVMAGAHLDSVPAGPGINDNGSGSAALLEIAEQMAKVRSNNKVRFAWWGAEEAGLVGSLDWVSRQADSGELDNVALYLNFDMIGSPNYVRFVYDGDNSDTGTPGDNPPGSEVIEQLFVDYFGNRHLPTAPTEIGARSDHFGFVLFGIPVGGLFTGAEELKTADQAATYGGTAGVALDPCYHQACDTFANNSNRILGQMSDAAAFAILTYAMNTESVTGLISTDNLRLQNPEQEMANIDGSS